MLLELKRDDRKKDRLIISKETGSHASPVAYLVSIRMLVFMAGLGDVISINDVSVAFRISAG